jgi:hypothetical protein
MRDGPDRLLIRQHVKKEGADGESCPPNRPGEPDTRILYRICGMLLHPDDRAEKRDKHRRRSREPKLAQRPNVAHFMHVNRCNDPNREPPAVRRRIGKDTQ